MLLSVCAMSSPIAPFEHQVAGSHSGACSRLLRGEFGRLLKPYKTALISPLSSCEPDAKPSGALPDKESIIENYAFCGHSTVCIDERHFYELLQHTEDTILQLLLPLLPRYFGYKTINVSGTDVPHLVLEDLTRGCRYPCVTDIKIGAVREYPGKMSNSSIADKTKYPSLKEMGWCIPGMQQYSADGRLISNFGPLVGRSLSTCEVRQYIRAFSTVTCSSVELTRELQDQIIEGLQSIANWFMKQRKFWFRSSSILIVYNAESFCTNPSCNQLYHLNFDIPNSSDVVSVNVEEFDSKANSTNSIFHGSKNGRELSDCSCDCKKACSTSQNSSENESSSEIDDLVKNKIDAESNSFESTKPSGLISSARDKNCCHESALELYKDPSITERASLTVRVKMIDFAHVLNAKEEEDTNYLKGLNNLIEFLRQCRSDLH